MNQSDLVIIVGTSLTLRYIADLPFLPKQNGGNVANGNVATEMLQPFSLESLKLADVSCISVFLSTNS